MTLSNGLLNTKLFINEGSLSTKKTPNFHTGRIASVTEDNLKNIKKKDTSRKPTSFLKYFENITFYEESFSSLPPVLAVFREHL